MTISFTTTREESDLIVAIVDRAEGTSLMLPAFGARMNLVMDLTATHANGCPLDLEGLLAAEPFDFAHDVAGIQRHINRETGQLEDCFLPRYSRRDAAVAAD